MFQSRNLNKIIIRTITTIFITNALLIAIYCMFFLENNVNFELASIEKKFDTVLDSKINKDMNNTKNFLTKEADKLKIDITLFDIQNNIVFSTTNSQNKNYSKFRTIIIDNIEYILLTSTDLNFILSLMTSRLLFLELLIVLLITIVSFKILNRKLLILI